MRRTPGPSTARGFSMKMFLPAWTAASKWYGRKPGGVTRIIKSTSLLITFWYASKPLKRCASSTATRPGFELKADVTPLSPDSRRSSKMSPIATSFVAGLAVRQSPTAPQPRPPAPTKPTRIVSSPFAYARGESATLLSRPAPTATVVDVFMKSRRDVRSFCGSDMEKTFGEIGEKELPGQRADGRTAYFV